MMANQHCLTSKCLPSLEAMQWLKGEPKDLVHDIRLCVLIQTNCPGCHRFAIPTANQLIHDGSAARSRIDVWCLATAFEDFDYNTIDNTRKPLQGELVGASRRQLGATAPEIPDMPLAFDILVDRESADQGWIDAALSITRQNAREQAPSSIPSDVLESALRDMGSDILPQKLAHVFYAAHAQGTPTWILHRASGEILDRCFGHMSTEDILKWVQDCRVHFNLPQF